MFSGDSGLSASEHNLEEDNRLPKTTTGLFRLHDLDCAIFDHDLALAGITRFNPVFPYSLLIKVISVSIINYNCREILHSKFSDSFRT